MISRESFIIKKYVRTHDGYHLLFTRSVCDENPTTNIEPRMKNEQQEENFKITFYIILEIQGASRPSF